MDDDGLLACGVPGVQLTWMDAKVGDRVVTPRIGKPVEVEALWINALRCAGGRYDAMAARAQSAFRTASGILEPAASTTSSTSIIGRAAVDS